MLWSVITTILSQYFSYFFSLPPTILVSQYFDKSYASVLTRSRARPYRMVASRVQRFFAAQGEIPFWKKIYVSSKKISYDLF